MRQSSAGGRRQCQCRRRRCPIGEVYGGRLQRTGIADREVSITREGHGTGIVSGGGGAGLPRNRGGGRGGERGGGKKEREIGGGYINKNGRGGGGGIGCVLTINNAITIPFL